MASAAPASRRYRDGRLDWLPWRSLASYAGGRFYVELACLDAPGAKSPQLHTVELVTRFLPYSTKGRLPTDARLVRAYLAFRPAWWLLGRQTLLVAEARA